MSGEDKGMPYSFRRFRKGRSSRGGGGGHSSGEEESYRLSRRKRFRKGEDDGKNNESDGFQFPLQNPNLSPNSVHSEKDESSSDEISSRSPSPPIGENEEERKSGGSHNGGKSSLEDRISSLPDCILVHIVSLLPAKAGIRTGVLSKRGIDLWRSSPNIVFHYDDVESKFSNFANSVVSTLVQYSSPKIKKFHLHTSCSPYSFRKKFNSKNSPVDSMLRFAIEHDVEALSLKFCHLFEYICYRYGGEYVLPQYLFDCSCLTKLSLSDCSFKHKGLVSWGSLRKLTICNSDLTNDLLQKIFLGSPLLECLELMKVNQIDKIDVGSKSRLERLVIRYDFKKLELSIPTVKSLEIWGCCRRTRVKLLNAVSLVNVRIEFHYYNYQMDVENESGFVDMVIELFQQINHAYQLTLGCPCIRVLSLLEQKALPSPLVKCNFKSLTLNLREFDDSELPGIVSLLNNSPTLEKLVVDFHTGADDHLCNDELPNFKSRSGKPHEQSYSCVLGHLKTIEFVGLERCSCNGAADTVVQFLLQNASVLEKVVLHPALRSSPLVWLGWDRKLLAIQKASLRALIFQPDLPMEEED